VLSLGIGLTAAMFALTDPYLLRPLPYASAQRLVAIAGTPRIDLSSLFSRNVDAPGPTIQEMQARTDLFVAVAAVGSLEELQVKTTAASATLRAVAVSENFFDVLGVRVNFALPWQAGAEKRLAISAAPRSRGLGSPAGLLGKPLAERHGSLIRVAAVLPPEFVFPAPRAASQPDAVFPRQFGATTVRTGGRIERILVIARLRPGISPETVQAALSTRPRGGAADVEVQPLQSYLTGSLRPMALGALAAALLISLVCAANTANLMIARGAYRKREFAMRTALGASRLDMLRLVLAELSLIASASVLVSLALTRIVLAFMGQVIPAQYALLGRPAMTGRVVTFACLLTAAIVIVAIVPAWFSGRAAHSSQVSRALASEARRVKLLRFAMATGQSAAAMILLVCGVLLVRSYIILWSQDTGFSQDAALVTVSYPRDEPSTRVAEDINSTIAHLRLIPGVAAAGALVGPFLDEAVTVGGNFVEIAGHRLLLVPREVTDGYFAACGARLRAGRLLRPGDRGWNAIVANEAFARRLWPDRRVEEAVGQVGKVDNGNVMEIVGVVQDTFEKALDRKPAPRLYRMLSRPSPMMSVNYLIKGRDGSFGFLTAAQQAVRRINMDAVVSDAGPVAARLAGTVKARTFATMILSLFMVAGLGVTASGLFGIVAFVVARRTHEVAIRRALGAQSRHVVWVVIREAGTAAAFGSAGGLLLGRWLANLLESQVYSITPGDSLSLAAAILVMVVVAGVAALIPARRALRLSPTDALRIE
jgi:predicted permease